MLRRFGTVLVRWREASVLIVAIAMAVYFQASKDVFLTHDNLRNIAQATAPTAIVAVGIVLLLVSGEIDLSVGVVAALAPFLVHYAVDLYGVPVVPAFLLAFVISAAIGFCNGFIVTKLRVPSLVATLGMYYFLLGVLLTTSHAYPAQIPEEAQGRIQQIFGAADWASLTWCLAIVLFFHIVLTRTRWGAAHDLGRRQPDRRHRGGHPGQPDKDRQLHDRERARRPRRDPGGVPDQQHRPQHRRRYRAGLHRHLRRGHRRHRPGRAVPARSSAPCSAP
nr:hypothetical protein GCM10020092_073150 [Actinoplanes digitatis]